MVRLVLDAESPAVAVDFKGGNFGRGVWVHPRPQCVARACKVVTRELGSDVEAPALHALLVAAAERRALSLIVAARRAGKLAVGSTAVKQALGDGSARVLVVATDARAAATTPWVEQAVAAGRVVAWSTKDELGEALGRQEAGVIAVLDDGLKEALEHALEVVHMAAPDAAISEGRHRVDRGRTEA
jgi:ribosomal protein L7Ae-like RNA K-turn-binding protein